MNTVNEKDKQKQQLIKMAVFAGIGIIFLLSMWFIFKPSEAEQQADLIGLGLNDNVPQATTDNLPDDKTKAYEQAWKLDAENEKKESLSELANYFDKEAQNKQPAQQDMHSKRTALSKSVAQYRNTHRELADFYKTKPDNDQEKEQLKEQIKELEERLKIEKQEDDAVNEQLALMEKSYEMAAKYMPKNSNNEAFVNASQNGNISANQSSHFSSNTKLNLMNVQAENKTVVSALAQNVSDSVFIKEQFAERNRTFHSVQSQNNKSVIDKNTLKVCVHNTCLLRERETVALRLLENAQVGNLSLPENTLLTAFARIQGNRLQLTVTSIAYKEQIMAVKLSAFELDGQEGVFIPGSAEMNAIKEVAANMGSSTGQSFTFSASAGQQLAADLGKGVLQGTSKYLNKKIREVKVTLKAGHLLYLVQSK